MSLLYINNHTHASQLEHEVKASTNDGTSQIVAVQSLFYGQGERHPMATYITMGIHPMQSDVIEIRQALQGPKHEMYHTTTTKLTDMKGLIAIGECGFDKRSLLTPEAQEELFNMQIEWSEEFRLPMILHNVGGTEQIIAARKRSAVTMPWVMHGFRKHPNEGEQLLRLGITLSFCPSIIGAERLRAYVALGGAWLLETDEKETSICSEYAYAAEVLGISMEEMCQKTALHFREIYGVEGGKIG